MIQNIYLNFAICRLPAVAVNVNVALASSLLPPQWNWWWWYRHTRTKFTTGNVRFKIFVTLLAAQWRSYSCRRRSKLSFVFFYSCLFLQMCGKTSSNKFAKRKYDTVNSVDQRYTTTVMTPTLPTGYGYGNRQWTRQRHRSRRLQKGTAQLFYTGAYRQTNMHTLTHRHQTEQKAMCGVRRAMQKLLSGTKTPVIRGDSI